MVTVKIGKHTVEAYDSIEELPIARFHRYQKYLLIDAGVGADIASFDARIERTRRYMMAGDAENAGKELMNLRQSVNLIQNGVNPKHLAFCALVYKIDGKPADGLTDDQVRQNCRELEDGTDAEVTAALAAVKKKIDEELQVYFPALFNTPDTKDYYDLMRRRTLAVLDAICEDRIDDPRIIELTTQLLLYAKPKQFDGSDGLEVQFDRQFENLCLCLSEQMGVKPKEMTVLEFYNAFDFLQERARRNAREQGGRKAAK